MKHLAAIQAEFLKFARKWEELPFDFQKAYIERHPGTRRHVTAVPPPKSPTSGLKVYEPHRGQSHDVLTVLRSATNAAPDASPVWKKYVTMRNEQNNKYHYFGVFPSKDGGFVAANVWGRIGYPPKGVAVLSHSNNENGAIAAAEEKLNKKMKKGYVPTGL